MRLRLLSDLHLEFGPLRLPEIEADVVLLAGDVHVGTRGISWCREHFSEVLSFQNLFSVSSLSTKGV